MSNVIRFPIERRLAHTFATCKPHWHHCLDGAIEQLEKMATLARRSKSPLNEFRRDQFEPVA